MAPNRASLRHLLLPLALAACGEDPAEPPPAGGGDPTDAGHTFSYSPPVGAPAITSISVRGSFNEWDEKPMARGADGFWKASVELEDGTYQYKFFINGAWIPDMCRDETWGHENRSFVVDLDADACVSDGFGGQNAVVVIGQPALGFSHDPTDPAHVSVADGRLSVRFRARQGQVASASMTVDGVSSPMHLQLTHGLEEIWRGSLPEGTSRYTLRLQTPDSTRELGPYAVPAGVVRAVPWLRDAVGYQIFPERFWNGDPSNDHWTLETDEFVYRHPATGGTEPVLMDTWGGQVLESHCCHQYFGGDLQGIIDRLDHLDALGVTVLYLNPIFLAGSAHGYDTFDYLRVAPNFGDEALLRSLLDMAHARGMRVIWDFVPNHVGIGNGAFQDAVRNGQASEHWDWFRFFVPPEQIQAGNGNHYEAWWGLGSLPELQTENREVLDHLLAITAHWTSFGFDGIRVDVPNEIENRSEFFRAFRQTAKSIDPEVYLVGEIWDPDPSWLRGDEFDALMNYALGQGVVERFARGEMTGGAAAQGMAQLYADYPEAAAAMLFNLLASHDTDRLLTKMGGGDLGGSPSSQALGRQRLASAMLFALPGMPVTFQGDECAFLGSGAGPQQKNRYPFQWDACDTAMLAHYAELARLKGSVEALGSSVVRAHSGAGPLLSFYRGEPGPGEVLAVFNSGSAPQSVTLPAGGWADLVTGASLSGAVQIEALGWRYLQRG